MRAPRIHWSLKESIQRVIESIAPIVQITIAALTGYSIAHFGLGHAIPLFAVTVSITSLGFTRDARPRRVLETAAGMTFGIALSETLLNFFGSGLWQMGVILALSFTLARFVNSSAAFALTAGIQSMLVVLLPAPAGGVYVRSIDGLIGGTVALLVTALIPRNPRGMAIKDGDKLFDMFLASLAALRTALLNVDVKVADEALNRVRRSQPLIDNWRMSLDTAISISRISPFMRKHREDLSDQVRLLRGMDLAMRNLRVVVRRVDFLLRDGQKRPYLADLMEQLAEAVGLLAEGLESAEKRQGAQEKLVAIIHQLDPKKFGIADQLTEASVLLLLRPMLVDLLCASGMSEDDARAELPKI
ncbi:MAG: hypothetical protein RL149_796 [Actinomycetota bacterium]|jgi:uncharacterized membrane protein YgaE (UPF0421/DUF939 family)